MLRETRYHLIKVSDDLIEEPQTLQSFFIDVTLSVELFEVWHRGEHHTYTVIRLIVEVLEKRNGHTHTAQRYNQSFAP